MVRMYKDTLLNTHMRKKKDELGGLECTFEGFLCSSFHFVNSSSVPPLATFFPPHSRNMVQGEYPYLHPGKCGSRLQTVNVSIACMYVWTDPLPGPFPSRLAMLRDSPATTSYSPR